MATIELLAILIVLGALVVRLRAGEPRRLALDLAAILVAAWLGENSCIRAYGFYAYAPEWTAFVDRVPLLIVVIWPMLIFSARTIVTAFLPDAGPARHAAVTALLVTVDASFIEPVATFLGLWHWTEPGLFTVPPIGILGWGFFAGAITWFLARGGGRMRVAGVLLAPVATHLCLLAAWWCGLRWVNLPIPSAGALAWAALVSGAGVLLALVDRAGVRRIGLPEMLSRLAGAIFFFGLLFLTARPPGDLALYAGVFAVPYTLLLGLQKGSSGKPTHLQA